MRQPVSHYDEYYSNDDGFELVGEEREDDYQRPDRRLPTIALTLAAMALFAGGLWFAYVQGTKHSAVATPHNGVPLIRADDRPIKVKPDEPGGMKIPNQNVSLYNDGAAAPGVEKLLPIPEQPMPRPAAVPKPAAPPPPAVAAAPAAPAEAAPAAPVAPPAAAAQRRASAAAAAKSAPTANGEPKATSEPRASNDQKAHGEQKAAAAAKPSAHAKPAAPAAAAEPAAGGRIRVRLASLRTPDAARVEWARLKREYPDLLGNLSAVAVRTDLGDKGIYYRVQAGPFADAAAAERLCAELKRRDHGCILAR